MKQLLVFAVLAGVMMFGLPRPAAAEVIPNVKGLTAFTAATNFMSLPGYLRWQYVVENNVWISSQEAKTLVDSQIGGA